MNSVGKFHKVHRAVRFLRHNSILTVNHGALKQNCYHRPSFWLELSGLIYVYPGSGGDSPLIILIHAIKISRCAPLAAPTGLSDAPRSSLLDHKFKTAPDGSPLLI